MVTPTYNGAEFVEECIASVLAQEYPNLEYIVIDGGSTDGTDEILRRYDENLTHWVSEPDKGQADAINKGFRRASGELVCWLNADDYFLPGALMAGARAYLKDPTAPFYFGNGRRVDRQGKTIHEFFPHGVVVFRREAFALGLNTILQPATFIRRAALDEIGYLDDTLHYGFDSHLWLELSALGEPKPIPALLAASREYEETKTASGSFPRAEELRQIAERHSGLAATPGSVSYYLDTLHRFAKAHPDMFPAAYVAHLEYFWSSTAGLLARYGVRPDGFPVPDASALARSRRMLPPKVTTTPRVGVELRQVTRGASGGIVVVLVGTLLELFRRRPDIDFVVFATVFNSELLEADLPNVHVVVLPLEGYFTELARRAEDAQLDVLIRSYPTVQEVDFPRNRQVFVIPDVQHEHHPEFFDPNSLELRRRAFSVAFHGAGAIMTISEFARATIEELASEPRDVFVASPALPSDFVSARSDAVDEHDRSRLPERDFFYFPANLWQHKNHERLLQAFERYRQRTGRDVELVLTGDPRGWDAVQRRHPDLPVRHLGYVSAPLVRLLYERAIALVFFSEYEGFGIPLLEAFEVGTPVVCSNTTSLPEVARDAVLMCDPTDIDAMAALLERIETDTGLREELVLRGKERLREYTWEGAADSLAAALERVADAASRLEASGLPLVSIVTPSFNQGRFIRRTIDSVVAQTYPNIEYLVVDGASTDETLNVLRSYGDSVRWVSEPDSGQTEAINKGLSGLNGEIFAYLNSDDVLMPDAVEKAVAQFLKRPECDLVYGNADYIDENDAVIGAYPTDDYSLEGLLESCFICQPAAFWRARVVGEVGTFDESLKYAMDYDYWIRVATAGCVLHHLDLTLAQSRLHAETKTLSARGGVYREILELSLRRGGYVSRHYVDGYWHHLAFESGNVVFLPLSWLPGLRRVLAAAHTGWLNRHRLRRRQVVRRLAKGTRGIMFEIGRTTPGSRPITHRAIRGLARRSSRSLTRLHRILSIAANGGTRVRGFSIDNWVAPRLDVLVEARETPREFRIAGVPVAGMRLEVAAGNRPIDSFVFEADRLVTATFSLPPGTATRVSLVFSAGLPDRGGRTLSFLLEGTNIFAEEDLASWR